MGVGLLSVKNIGKTRIIKKNRPQLLPKIEETPVLAGLLYKM